VKKLGVEAHHFSVRVGLRDCAICPGLYDVSCRPKEATPSDSRIFVHVYTKRPLCLQYCLLPEGNATLSLIFFTDVGRAVNFFETIDYFETIRRLYELRVVWQKALAVDAIRCACEVNI
jgi:hypothetical protein